MILSLSAQSLLAQTTLYLHANPNPKFQSLVEATPGIMTFIECRTADTKRILFRSANQDVGVGLATLSFIMGGGVSSAGAPGCQFQNGSEFVFWTTPPLTSDYDFSGTTLTVTLGCRFAAVNNLGVGFGVYKWDGRKDSFSSTTRLISSAIPAACGTTAVNRSVNGTFVASSSLKKGDRLIIAPVIFKTGGGGAAADTATIYVDAASGMGAATAVFPAAIPFASVTQEATTTRKAYVP